MISLFRGYISKLIMYLLRNKKRCLLIIHVSTSEKSFAAKVEHARKSKNVKTVDKPMKGLCIVEGVNKPLLPQSIAKGEAMSTFNRSTVTGAFQNEAQAQQAMADLQNAGFSTDQIRYSVHRGGSGILDSLLGLGLGNDEANYYNSEFMAGRTVVTVKTEDRQQEAYNILRRYNAYDWSSRAGQGLGSTGAANAYDTSNQGPRKMQLKEEQLLVQKQQVQSGEVGIHKEVISEERTMNVPVNREEVYIERNPVSGNVPSDTPIGQDETIRVPVREEQVQVSKQPVVKEEINIGKRVVQENQQVSDTVRREEARVDREGDVNVEGTDIDNINPPNNQGRSSRRKP
jgi:uncharacterized protein (TIGR02271 family)